MGTPKATFDCLRTIVAFRMYNDNMGCEKYRSTFWRSDRRGHIGGDVRECILERFVCVHDTYRVPFVDATAVYRNGYQWAGKGKWVSMTLKRPKKAGGAKKKKPVRKEDDEDDDTVNTFILRSPGHLVDDIIAGDRNLGSGCRGGP